MRIAAGPAHAVAGHTVGLRPLLVAGRATDDVLPGGGSVEARAAGHVPACGVRALGVGRTRRQLRLAVALLAEGDHMARLAARLVPTRLDRVPRQVITPVDEVLVHRIRLDRLNPHWSGHRGVALRAEALLV